MPKRICAFLVLLTVLCGCEKQSEAADPGPQQEPPVNPQSEVLTKAEQAGMLEPEPEPEPKEHEPHEVDEAGAAALVSESIDSEKYVVALAETQLQVAGAEGEAHDFYVFDVTDTAGAAVGQVAIDRETGEKYHYLGAGTLDDYSTFPLYDASVDAVCDWQGTYTTGTSVPVDLEILQGDANSFEYRFSDGTSGNARISGNTAKSTDEKINFLFTEEAITVVGDTVTGNYTAV